MKNLIYLLPLLILACSTENTNESENTAIQVIEKTVIAKEDIKTDSQVVMEISGMTCEMGCVSTIRNHVTQMKGSTNFEMNFDTERTTDFATISFDSRLLSQEDIKEEIESIAQGLYAVVETKELSLEETRKEIEFNTENR
jgi:mercuric ion binding protein